jgi:hypothetical protein
VRTQHPQALFLRGFDPTGREILSRKLHERLRIGGECRP